MATILDIYDRMVVDCHIGLSCTGEEVARALLGAYEGRRLEFGDKPPVLRTENGPLFLSRAFGRMCERLGIEHEFVPVQTPNAIAHVETYHSRVGTFVAEAAAWQKVMAALEEGKEPDVRDGWTPAEDAEATARRLADLFQRRLLAAAQERLAAALYDPSRPAHELATLLEEEAAQIQQAVRELRASQLQWAADLVDDALREAEDRRQQREETGRAATGLPTGLDRLDEILNGWRPSLHILAGGPSKGKTTLALQFAQRAAADRIPVVYVTFENSPNSLVLKALCSRAGLAASDVERGFANLLRLREVAASLQSVLEHLAFVEGSQRTTVAQVRAKALSAPCFIIFDYLQQAAHSYGYDQLRFNVSKLAGELRDLVTRLGSPVLALSSYSRQDGQYGNGGGRASLDSLKESGDRDPRGGPGSFPRDADHAGTLGGRPQLVAGPLPAGRRLPLTEERARPEDLQSLAGAVASFFTELDRVMHGTDTGAIPPQGRAYP